jgi:hypothetical protein
MRQTGGLLLKIGVCGSKKTGEVIPRVVVPMSMLVEYSICFILSSLPLLSFRADLLESEVLAAD